MLTIKDYRQKYKLKFPQQLIPNDILIFPEKGICRFIQYIQCVGMGSFEYGEYGILYYSDQNEDCHEIMIYKHFPLLVKDE